MQELGSQPDLYNFLMHLSMLSYLDYRVANSLLGVEWTIPIEVFWYVCLPLLLHFTKNIPKAVGSIPVLLVSTGGLSYASKQLFGTSQPIKWSPIAHGHLFVVGAAAFYLRERFAGGGSGLAQFLVVYSVTVALSTGTYLLVEKPINRMGCRLAEAGQLAGSTASPKVEN